MKAHFRMCASAHRGGGRIEATAYAGLPDRCHEGKITRIGEDSDVLEIFIDFTRRAGPCPDEMIWTWEEHCVVPDRGQQKVRLIGSFEGNSFAQGGSIFDSTSKHVTCGFIVIARDIEHDPPLGCLSVLGGTEPPQGYSRVYPPMNDHRERTKADCEDWRRENCASHSEGRAAGG